MTHIAAIILILGLCLPQALLAGEVLQAGEIDSSKVKLGAYAEVIYGTGERDQVSGKWEKLDTAQGYVKAVDAESLTISQGLGKRIAFEHIQQLILTESSFQMDRLKKTTDTLSGKKENKPNRIVGKLFVGVLGGGLFALAGGAVGINVGNCPENEAYCEAGKFLVGGWFSYLIGVPAGMSLFDPYDQFKYSLAGSLIGGAVSLVIFTDKELAEKLWPSLLICPLVGATILSELSRELPENRRISIGLLPGPKGRLHAVAMLRF